MLAATVLASTGLGGCSYHPSATVQQFADKADTTVLKIPAQVPQLLTRSEISKRFKADTLEYYAALAVATSPAALADYYAVGAHSAGIAQARSMMLPTIGIDAGTGATDNRAYTTIRDQSYGGLTATWTLFDGGKSAMLGEKERCLTLEAIVKMRETRESVSLGSIESVINLLRHREMTALYEEDVHEDAEYVTKIRAMVKAGNTYVSEADAVLAEAKKAQAEQRLTESRQLVRDEEARFERIHGLPAPRTLKVPSGLPVDKDSKKAVAVALTDHPSEQITRFEAEAALRQIFAVDAERMGSFALKIGTLGFAVGEAVVNPFALGSLIAQLSIPVYDGGERDARMDGAIAAYRAAFERRGDISAVVKMAVLQALSAWTAAGEQERLTAEEAAKLRIVKKARWLDYQSGRSDIRSVLDSETELDLAHARSVTARWERVFSAYRVTAAQGKLVAKLNLADERKVVLGEGEFRFRSPEDLVRLDTARVADVSTGGK